MKTDEEICVSTCPDEYYIDNNECRPCTASSNCKTCDGPTDPDECLTCYSSGNNLLKTDEKICVSSCPAEEYYV